MWTRGDVGHDLSYKTKKYLGQENTSFFLLVQARVREERKRRAKSFLPRSMKFRWSEFIGLRTKVHCIDEAHAWVPKTWDFADDSNEKFGKSKVSGLGSVHKAS